MTRQKKATGKDTKLPNPLADGRKPPIIHGIQTKRTKKLKAYLALGMVSDVVKEIRKQPENIHIVAGLVTDESEYIRSNAAKALEEAAPVFGDIADENGMDSTLDVLVKALGDFHMNVPKRVAGILGLAALNGADGALPALLEALSSKSPTVREGAAEGLGKAVANESIREAVLNAFAKILHNKDANEMRSFIRGLGNAAEYDQKTRTLITRFLIGFTHSDWFRNEMEKNSVAYEGIAGSVAEVFGRMKKAEAAQP